MAFTVGGARALLRLRGFPDELIDNILDHLGIGPESQRHTSISTATSRVAYKHPALSPPLNGSCPFLSLPTEVRRDIFSSSLPARDTVVQPRCDDEHGPKTAVDDTAKPRHNGTTDLMVLNNRICREVATVLYEEREFAIHVHEGITNGGIEFLDAGRQPLQYKDDLRDQRFVKFRHGERFGFDRLKKIWVDVYPCDGANRLVSMNTYYMNLALVALLERSEGDDAKNRITSLTISFSSQRTDVQRLEGRRAIANAELYWWDAGKDQPRETNIHGTSNIQLVLLPFSRLRCHNVRIHLPHRLASHAGTTAFVDRLVNTMTDSTMADMVDGLLHQLETQRDAYNDYITRTLFGGKTRFDVPKLSEADMLEEEPDSPQYELSSYSDRGASNTKRRKSDDDEDEQLQAALYESAQQLLARPRSSRRSSPPMPGSSFTGQGRTLGGVRQAPQDSFAGQGRTLEGMRGALTQMTTGSEALNFDRRFESAAPGRRLLANLPRLDAGARGARDEVNKWQRWASNAAE